MIGMGFGETFETVEAIDAALQSERIGGLVQKIDPPAFKDAKFGDISLNVLVAKRGKSLLYPQPVMEGSRIHWENGERIIVPRPATFWEKANNRGDDAILL